MIIETTETIETMEDHRLNNPDVEIYLAMSYKFSLPPELVTKLEFHKLWNPTAKQLAARLNINKGFLGKDKQFTPMYQNCSRSMINALSKHYLRSNTKFWVSFRSYKDYHVALIQPDNRYITTSVL